MAAKTFNSGRALAIGGVLVFALGSLLPGVMAQTFPRDENDATSRATTIRTEPDDPDQTRPIPRTRRSDLIDRRLRIQAPRTGNLRRSPDEETERTFGDRPMGVTPLPSDQSAGQSGINTPDDANPNSDDRTRNRLGLRSAILDDEDAQRDAPLSVRTNPTRQLNEARPAPTRRGAGVAARVDPDVQPRIERLPRPTVYELSNAADTDSDSTTAGPSDQTTVPTETAALPDDTSAAANSTAAEDNADDAGRGLTLGWIRLFPQLDTRVGSTSNAGGSGDANDSAVFTRIEPQLRARTLWSRHEVEAELRGAFDQFSGSANTDQTTFDGALRGRIDVTDRTRINLEGTYNRTHVQRGETGAPDTTENRPFVHRSRLAGTLTQTLNRLTVSLTGSVEEEDFENALQRNGTVADNGDLDFRVEDIRLRGAYDLSEKTSVFIEGFADREIYDNKVDATGFRQGSDGLGLIGGATWRPSAKLELTGSVGLETRDGNDPTVGTVTETIFEGNATWRPTTLTTLNAALRQSLDITNEDGATSVLTREAELSASHQLRPRIELTGGVLFGRDTFKGSDREDERISAQAGIEYELTRYIAFIADVLYERLDSNTSGEDDEEAEFSVGLRWRY